MRSKIHAALVATITLAALTGCGRAAIVQTELPLKRVVVYRNGVAYFERAGHVEEAEVKFKMKQSQVGDFLATLAVMEKGGSSVRAAAFPLKMDDENDGAKPKKGSKEALLRAMKTVVLSLDGNAHDLAVGYVAEAPVWRPSYRLVVQPNGEADLQAWGIVENLSGEDWRGISLSLVAGAPLAFEAMLGTPVIPQRPVVTDLGEVVAAIPRGETSLGQGQDRDKGSESKPEMPKAEAEPDDATDEPAKPGGFKNDRPAASGRGAAGPNTPAAQAPPPPPAPADIRVMPGPPRNLRSLAAVAVEGGSTRYDIPVPVTVPDKSATMVLLLSKRVPGEANFLFSPDDGVPDSVRHPFRVARFTNRTAGVLERGPIAVFESGSFLGQGLVDPLPSGATATVPFALERALAVDRDRQHDESGERVAKIENGQLMIERDAVTKTKYRVKSGSDLPSKLLIKHPRQNGARLHEPPKDTEDNVGTGHALVPFAVAPRETVELVVDERASYRRWEDWFSIIADNAVKAYIADPKADRAVAQKLAAAWVLRTEIAQRRDTRVKIDRERAEIAYAQEETRKNLKVLEKNKGVEVEKLRTQLTHRLTDLVGRSDERNKDAVENGLKLSELEVRFREAVREIKLAEVPSPK